MTIIELIAHLAIMAQHDPTAKVAIEGSTPTQIPAEAFRMGKGLLLVDVRKGKK